MSSLIQKMHQEGQNEQSLPTNDFSIQDLKKTLDESNLNLLESLKERYMQELIGSMVFFVFNEVCQNKKPNSDNLENEKDTPSDIFISHWLNSVKKEAKKELLDINNKLKDKKMNFLSAISNYSLPSTEDYQDIYNKAIFEVHKIFQDNTKI